MKRFVHSSLSSSKPVSRCCYHHHHQNHQNHQVITLTKSPPLHFSSKSFHHHQHHHTNNNNNILVNSNPITRMQQQQQKQQSSPSSTSSNRYSSLFVQPEFSTNDEMSYEKTMQALESLILRLPKSNRPSDTRQQCNLEAMNSYMNRLNISEQQAQAQEQKYDDDENDNVSRLLLSSDDQASIIPPVIHIAGTKGKGSTCAFCESILRNCGYKTGMFTSPHLIDVRERIRINGQPVSKPVFMQHFWYCYRRLMETTNEVFPSMATYFRFLTVLAFRIFAHEGVQVSILEVGVGGVYDSTNIIKEPLVCGITSIGMDHTDLLGENLDQIALQKAGIMKPNSVCITTQGQRDIVKRVFYNFAQSDASQFNDLFLSEQGLKYYNVHPLLDKCRLTMKENGSKDAAVEQITLHKNPLYESRFELFSDIPLVESQNNLLSGGEHQRWNAALAIALCETFIYLNDRNAKNVLKPETVRLIEQRMQAWNKSQSEQASSSSSVTEINNEHLELEPYQANGLSDSFVRGLLSCAWPGRGHVIPFSDYSLLFYLDGAHTDDSIQYCTQWFKRKSLEPISAGTFVESTTSLEPAVPEDDAEIELRSFVQNAKTQQKNQPSMKNVLVFNYTGTRDPKDLLAPLAEECEIFDYVVFLPIDSQKTSLSKKSSDTHKHDPAVDDQIKRLQDLWLELTKNKQKAHQQIVTKEGINALLRWAFEQGNMHLLVTGSFYLVGDFLRKLSTLQ